MKWFNLILRLALGGLFLYAGVVKIIDPAGFAKSIGNYRLLGHEYLNLAAITLPWIETLAGGLLVVGIWRRANALLIAGMLVMFIFAISYALAQGLNINCGCTGTTGGAKVGWLKISENIGWLIAAGWLLWKERD